MARPRSVSDEDILGTTRACALERGPSVSLDEIASKLKVSTPALLKRFGTRNKLMLAALRPPTELPFLPWLQEGPNDEPLRGQIEEMLDKIAQFFMGVFPCMMVLRESGMTEREIWGGHKPHPKVMWGDVTEWLKRAHKQGLIKAEECEAASYAIIGAVTSRIATSHMMKHPITQRELRAYIKDCANLFSRALQTKERST